MPQKNEKLLHDLIENYATTFARLALRYGVPYDDAEDIVMEAIWAFYKSELYEKKDETEIIKIMTTIVKNKSIDFFRKENKDDVVEVDIDDEDVYIQLAGPESCEPEKVAVANDGYRHVVNIIEGLKDIWREPVKMYFVEDRSYEEISKTLEISEDVCRSRISRARKFLEKELKDMLS